MQEMCWIQIGSGGFSSSFCCHIIETRKENVLQCPRVSLVWCIQQIVKGGSVCERQVLNTAGEPMTVCVCVLGMLECIHKVDNRHKWILSHLES